MIEDVVVIAEVDAKWRRHREKLGLIAEKSSTMAHEVSHSEWITRKSETGSELPVAESSFGRVDVTGIRDVREFTLTN